MDVALSIWSRFDELMVFLHFTALHIKNTEVFSCPIIQTCCPKHHQYTEKLYRQSPSRLNHKTQLRPQHRLQKEEKRYNGRSANNPPIATRFFFFAFGIVLVVEMRVSHVKWDNTKQHH